MSNSKSMYYAAAATTAIAGIIHLYMAPGSLGFNLNTGLLFLVGGIAQLFWVIPMIRKWGLAWYGIGIGGTGILIAIWAVTRMPQNMINGRAGTVNQSGMLVEIMQAAFIALNMAILIYEKRKAWSAKTSPPAQNST